MAIVVTIDQRRSRRSRTQASELAVKLNAAFPDPPGFEVTVGDELQGLVAPQALTAVLRFILQRGEWWIGVGLGSVDSPGPSPRLSSGEAFYAARSAVMRAKKNSWGIAVEPHGRTWVAQLDAALALWGTLLGARTERGWEAVKLKEQGHIEAEIAQRLGITQQAVNQRLRAAYFAQDVEGAQLIGDLLAVAGELPRGSAGVPD